MSGAEAPKPVADHVPLADPDTCAHQWVPFRKVWMAPDAMAMELYVAAWCPACLRQRIGPKEQV